LDCGKLYGSLVGQSESQTAQAIAAIEACAPCVLLIDEVEKGLAGIGGGGPTGDSGTTQRVGQSLLTWLNDRDSAVFVVATANRLEGLPPELLRPGRVDVIFAVDLPSWEERVDIAAIHLARRNRDLGPAADGVIADCTSNFSGAEIEQAIIDGMFTAFEEGRELELRDVVTAANGRTPLAKRAAEDIKRIRDWVSSGRALAASYDAKPEPSSTYTRGPQIQM
jgi:SpoVK/Ycf46/Vps4 family AAA+-type ATPase